MKKILSLLLCALLIAGLTACGTKADTAAGTGEKNEIGRLADEGYEEMMSAWQDGKWVGIYQLDDSYMKVTADFPPAAESAYRALDMTADDYRDRVNAIVWSLENVQTEDLSDLVPAQEELDAYIGMTFAALENDGYENCGWYGDAEVGEYTFMYAGTEYSLDVTPAEGTVIEDIESLSDADISALTIGSVTFAGFADGFLFE